MKDHSFEIGCLVLHPEYGLGRIKDTPGNRQVTVNFAVGPERTFVASRSPLKRCQQKAEGPSSLITSKARDLYAEILAEFDGDVKEGVVDGPEDWMGFVSLTGDNVNSLNDLMSAGMIREVSIAYRLACPVLRFSYHEYIISPEWKEKADAAKDRAGWRCQVCNTPRDRTVLDTHHRTYERLGEEYPSDLIVLCRECHDLFHKNGKLAKAPK